MGIGPQGNPRGRVALSRAGRVPAGKTVRTAPGTTAGAVPAQPALPAQPLPPVFELDVN
jgi:hypothetical protein